VFKVFDTQWRSGVEIELRQKEVRKIWVD
jgi:hypothetical protein